MLSDSLNKTFPSFLYYFLLLLSARKRATYGESLTAPTLLSLDTGNWATVKTHTLNCVSEGTYAIDNSHQQNLGDIPFCTLQSASYKRRSSNSDRCRHTSVQTCWRGKLLTTKVSQFRKEMWSTHVLWIISPVIKCKEKIFYFTYMYYLVLKKKTFTPPPLPHLNYHYNYYLCF